MITTRAPRVLSLAMAALTILSLLPATGLTGAGTTTGPALPDHGHHMVTFFWIDDAAGWTTTVLAAEDPDGALILKADVSARRLHVSDGYDGSVARPHLEIPLALTSGWHRVDVLLHGDTYSISVDQRATTTARTFAVATAGAWLDDARVLDADGMVEPVARADHRVDDGDGSYEHTFTTPLADGKWGTYEDGGEVDERIDQTGYRSPGSAEVFGALTPSVAYLHAPVNSFDGRFGADVSVRPSQNLLGGPIGQTVLAGLTGPIEAPSINWAFVIDRPAGTLDAWALFFEAPGGTRTQVGPASSSPSWASYRFTIVEPLDLITLRIEGGPATEINGHALSISEHVGIGDLDPGIGLDHGAGVMRVDDVALYPLVPGVAP